LISHEIPKLVVLSQRPRILVAGYVVATMLAMTAWILMLADVLTWAFGF
jgi:hypothetical protein